MIRALAASGARCEEIPLEALTGERRRSGEFTWIDIDDAQPADLDLLRREFGIHDLVVEDLTRRHQRPKIDTYGGYYFLVIYTIDRTNGGLDLREVGILLGTDYLVTVHDGAIGEIAETRRRWQNQPDLAARGSGALLYILLDAIVDDYFPFMDSLSDRVDDIEEAVLNARVKRPVREIFALRRDTARLRRVLGPERDVINSLLRREIAPIDESLMVYYQDLYDHITRVMEQVDTFRDLLSGALDAHLASQSNRLNTTMQRLTAWTIILMSSTLVAGIYGMNFDRMPELGWALGYPFALTLMIAIALSLFIYFKRTDFL